MTLRPVAILQIFINFEALSKFKQRRNLGDDNSFSRLGVIQKTRNESDNTSFNWVSTPYWHPSTF